jgi:nicotinamidase-related amidase
VVLAGMSANLCIESHRRELLEQGFEVAVVSDATAAAMTNFRYIAGTVLTTAETVKALAA